MRSGKFAADLQRILRATADVIDPEGPGNALRQKLTGHLRIGVTDTTVVNQTWRAWEHANLQRGVDAYLAERGQADWFGLSGAHRSGDDVMGLLYSSIHHGHYRLGAPDFVTVAIGPDEVTEAVQFGLAATTAPDGTPVILCVRGSNPHFGSENCQVEVLAADRVTATVTRNRIEQLMDAHNVFRGQVLSFGYSEHRRNELISFLPRPHLAADEVVLPEGALELIERHTVAIAEHRTELLAAGQHVKRGLLLHGPPGTGKTHTVRYLMNRLSDSTVIVLTGAAMGLIEHAANLARKLQPSVVVVEDVDLIARDRSYSPTGHPLLFSLLDAMDGIGGDADVTFLLTTNRAGDLEEALADRPGRVDLAVEIPRPDARGREALLRLYSRGMKVTADPAPIIAATEGQTASFIKELLRRAALRAIICRPDEVGTVVGDADLAGALAEMNDNAATLTRTLLGAPPEPGD